MTSWDGYLALGGTELANEERLRTYFANLWPAGPARKRELEPVEGLHIALGDTPYLDPASDMAPWVDLDDPRTEEFLGFRIQEIIGLDDAMDQAAVVESLGYGGTIGTSRIGSREIRVTGILHGLSPEGVQVGMTWLRRAIWQDWSERLLVPQQPGVSDLRFFIQRPEIPDQVVNLIANPNGSGLGESLVGAAGTARVYRVPISTNDDWGYRILARSTGRAEAQLQPLERARATPGQTWMARARVWRDASVVGPRLINVLLRFRDQYGNVITAVGPEDTRVDEGVLYRWTGVRWDSTSQMLTDSGMVTNWMVNPNGNGLYVGLSPYAGSPARAGMVGNPGKRNYRVKTNTAGTAASATGSAPVIPGQQWWGRAAVSISKASGGRHFRPDLVFFDRRGKVMQTTQGDTLDLVPTGLTHRWTGKKGLSISEQIAGDTKRLNYCTNPNPRTALTGHAARGYGSKIALERFVGFGTPFAIRCTLGPVPNPNGAIGMDIAAAEIPVGTTIYVTFWTIGQTSLRLWGEGWTGPNGESPGTGVPFTGGGSTPRRVSIRIKITAKKQRFAIIRHTAVTGMFRVGRIGLLTGSDSYFDGDTGRYEWEGKINESSSIAHLPGNYDLYNIPWNGGFNTNIARWTSGNGNVTVGWSKSTQRLAAVTKAALSSGALLAQLNMWPAIVGGQRLTAGMRVYNYGAAAISVATRITTDKGTNFDSATTSIPAGGSAWVAIGTTAMPSGTAGGSVRLVAKGSIASGVTVHIDKVFFGSKPDGSTAAEADWFDGYTPASIGDAFVKGVYQISVGDIAPEGAASVRLVLNRTSQGPTLATDEYNTNRIMLAQVSPVDTDVDDEVPPEPTLPAYFDGDFPSTFELFPTFEINSDVEATETDTVRYDALITGEAPHGAVTAELAIERTTAGAPAANDMLYADNLMLASYDPEETPDPPEFTDFTRRDFVSDAERWVQEVGAVAGPTVVSEQHYGTDGCRGATAVVEFTLVAQRAEHLYDRGDRVPIPLPQTVVAGGNGAGAFAKIEDTTGIVRNYMPQFDPNSPIIPSKWTASAAGGTITTAGVRANETTPYVLRVVAGSSTSGYLAQINGQNTLGPSGGYEAGVASIHLGCSLAGKQAKITVLAFKGTTQVASSTSTVTMPQASNADIVQQGFRFDVALPTGGANGAANGFVIRVEDVTANWGTVYIGMPQVTLTSSAQSVIYGGLPDDGTYTYDFDGIGYSRRTPTAEPESHTIFPNRAAPPSPRASLAGYDEVGQIVYRTFADIDAASVPRNAVAVPVARVDFERFVSRWVRFRFYPNPQNVAPEMIATGSFEYEWVIDQFAGNVRSDVSAAGFMSIVIDGVAQRVWLRAWDGTVVPGDQYVVTSNGTPINWPEFKDIPWVVSVDYPTFRQSSGTPTSESWWRASMALVIKE